MNIIIQTKNLRIICKLFSFCQVIVPLNTKVFILIKYPNLFIRQVFFFKILFKDIQDIIIEKIEYIFFVNNIIYKYIIPTKIRLGNLNKYEINIIYFLKN
jgi:hypothetical protein